MEYPSVHCTVQLLGKKYICYTRWECDLQHFLLVVSDGIDVWRIGLTEEDLDDQRDLVQCSSTDSLLQQIREAFRSCQLVVDRQVNRLVLSIGHWPIQFDLFEVASSIRKSELQQLVFRLADLSSELEIKLQGANSKIEELSQKEKVMYIMHVLYLKME
jgi:hypothetical protein